MPYLTVSHRGAHRFEVNVEGHRIVVDEEVAAGGRDTGPTPTQLLAASLASGAAAEAEAYLGARGYSTASLVVSCHYRMSPDHPRRVASIDVTITVPVELPADQRHALMKAVEERMVGNTLRMPPLINVMVATVDQSPAG